MRTRLGPLLLLALLGNSLAAQQVLQVPAQYPTIQAALDAASPGATVKVAAGIYHEHLALREDVELIGAGWRKTVIDGGGAGDVIRSDGVHQFLVRGFTVRGSAQGAAPGSGIYIHGATCCTFGVTARIELCRIADNGYGVRIENVHSGILTLWQNVIDRNQRHGVDPFIGTVLLKRNTLVGNGGSGYHATDGGGTNVLSSNVIALNAEYGVFRSGATPLTASYNNVSGNALGEYVQVTAGVPVTFTPLPGISEVSLDPGFYSLANGDYALTAGSALIDTGDPALPLDLDDSPADVGAFSYNPAYIPASTEFGDGCGPTPGWYWEPIVGQSYYELHLSGGPPSMPALLLLGISSSLWSGLPLPFDLGPAGAPGCALLTGPIVTFGTTVSPAGEAELHLAIPPSAELVGAAFFVQWAAPDPGANPLGVVFSGGVKVVVKL
jgi:hypothetical protein